MFSESMTSQGCGCIEKPDKNGQAIEAGTVPKASLLFLSQFRETKKASSALTKMADSEQRVQILPHRAKGFSRIWF